MVFHWSLSNNKSVQVSRTFLGILADLNTVYLSFYFQVYYAIYLCIGTTTTFVLHSFFLWGVWGAVLFFCFSYQGLGTYISFPFLLDLLGRLPGQQSTLFCRFLFFIYLFILTITRFDRLVEIKLSVCISIF